MTRHDLDELIVVQVWRQRSNRQTLFIGSATFEMHTICRTIDNKWIELHHEGKLTGKLNFRTQWKELIHAPLELTMQTILDWIGIDLGTTHTAAAYSKKGLSNRIAGVYVDMIAINLENGRPILPSVVRM